MVYQLNLDTRIKVTPKGCDTLKPTIVPWEMVSDSIVNMDAKGQLQFVIRNLIEDGKAEVTHPITNRVLILEIVL